VKGEGGEFRARADGPATINRADRAGGVLDDGNPALLAQCPHSVEVRGYARLVDQDNGTGAVGQVRFDGGRSQVLCVGVDVGEDRSRTNITDHVGGSNE
jgi:hypothetical protein